VGYRYFAMRQANALGVSGHARNLPDGRVELVAEADEAVLADFEARLREGPSFAEVANVEREPIAERGQSGFDIR
jgi:acylphosphatase